MNNAANVLKKYTIVTLVGHGGFTTGQILDRAFRQSSTPENSRQIEQLARSDLVDSGIQRRSPMLPKLIKRDSQQLPSQATPLPCSVGSLVNLPDSLRHLAMQSGEIANEPTSICVFPSRIRLKTWYSWEYIVEQALLFTTKGILHIKAPALPDQGAGIVHLRAADLLYTQLSLQLMYGRLELVDDCLSRVVVEFNASGFDVVQQGLQYLLGTSCPGNSVFNADAPLTETVLNELGRLSFKFKNGLHQYGLSAEEHLLGFVFQRSMWGRRWYLFPFRVQKQLCWH